MSSDTVSTPDIEIARFTGTGGNGEAGGDDASIDAIVGKEEAPAGEGEKNVVDADANADAGADAGAAAAPEVAAPEVVEPTAEDAEKEEI